MKALVVDRKRFQLELWEGSPSPGGRGELLRTYPIAVGGEGYRTRRGCYWIEVKDRQPDWRKPESSWIPKDQWGEVVPGGSPENPLKARWLGFDGKEGWGIHGTDATDSLGTAASHGCIRLSVDDVKDLYPQVATGTILFVD